MTTIAADDPLAVATVEAIHGGDLPRLKRLLAEHPELAKHGSATTIPMACPGRSCTLRPTGPATSQRRGDRRCPGRGWSRRQRALPRPARGDAAALGGEQQRRRRPRRAARRRRHIEAPGAVLGGGPPLADATGFGQWEAAHRLVQHGAQTTLSDAELARIWGAPRALGRALRVAGLVEGGQAGLGLLHEAVEVLDGSPARLELAKALTELGSALRRGKRRVQAREVLRRAVELATLCGATPLAQRAEAELLATGARPRRVALSGVDSLTPSERRVAQMAADGLTNREIAQTLFVATKTVEVHLSSVYRKLEISSRSQLPAMLAEPAHTG